MSFKFNRLKYFAFFHIGVLIFMGVTSTNYIYSVYHNRVPTNKVILLMDKCLSFSFAKYYTRYTGTETGFGFFAPNVRSFGTMMGKTCSKKFQVQFKSVEGSMRLNCMLTTVTDKLLQDTKMKTKQDTLFEKYNELLIKSIATNSFNNFNYRTDSCKTIQLQYYLVEYPSLKIINSSKKSAPYLQLINTWSYEF